MSDIPNMDGKLTDADLHEMDCGRNAINTLGIMPIAINAEAPVIESMLVTFVRQHRTTQQAIVRSFCMMLERWAELDRGMFVDGRNDAARDFAEDVADKRHRFPYL